MKIKLDENLPEGLVVALTGLGHDVDTVVHEGLGGGADDAIWIAAQDAGRFLITQDLDFWAGGLVIATERKLRVRRAGQ